MTQSESSLQEVVEEVAEETGVIYDPTEKKIQLTGEGNATTHYIDFVEFLIEEGIISEENLPYAAKYGQSRYIINTEPIHENGKDMIRPVEVSNGVFLETNHSTETKKRYMKGIIEYFVQDSEN